jgi:hypothetical protein
MHKSSYCGINCNKCKLYIATITNDDEMKTEAANEWSILYKRDFRKEEMVCKGCKSDTLFVLCSQCGITPCCIGRGIDNCEDCDIFHRCERIQEFFRYQKENNTGAVFE